MNELKEILEGKHEINDLYIDEDTLAFKTEIDNHIWNLYPRDIEKIIYRLQEENKRLNNIINELEKDMNRDDLSYVETQYVLDKIKELKGSDKE